MTLREALENAREALNAVVPTYIRDAIPVRDGKVILPERCIILDLIVDSKQYDFTDVISTVRLQVGCWSPSIATCLDDLVTAAAILEGTDPSWELKQVNPTQTDNGYRGVTADFSGLY